MVQVRSFEALISGSTVNGRTQTGAFVSYSFTTNVPTSYTGLYSAEALASFRPFTELEKAAAVKAIGAWAAVSGLSIFEVAPDQGDIKFGNYDFSLLSPGSAGFAFYPDNGHSDDIASDIFIGNGYATDQHVLLHEIGHALGLKHSFDGATTLVSDLDTYANTVMSYTSGGSPGDVLGQLDVDAIRSLYGDQTAKGSQVASWQWNSASRVLTQVGTSAGESLFGIGGFDIIDGLSGDDIIKGKGGDDILRGGAGNDSLDGGGGSDRLFGGDGDDALRLVITGSIEGLVVDGGAGKDSADVVISDDQARSISNTTLGLSGIERLNLSVGGGSDRIDIAGLDDISIQAGGGDDVISFGAATGSVYGGAGADFINLGAGLTFAYGGEGADRFIFSAASGSSSAAQDQIEDFQSGVDLIDLTGFAPTNLRIQAAGQSAFVYADSAIGRFQLFVRTNITMADIVTSGLTLSGDAAEDLLVGTAGADTLSGGAGNDTLIGGAGNDVLIGGTGIDRADYSSLFRSYAPSQAGGTVTLRGPAAEGTDQLTGVEYITFKDGVLQSDPDLAFAQVLRAYDTILDRAPDANGLDFYVDRMEDRGMSLVGVANDLAASSEFQIATGGLSNAQFVDYVYRHALDRGPDAGGAAFYTNALNQGMSRGAFVVDLSESAEHRGLTAGLVAQGFFNTDDSYQAVALLYDTFMGRLPDAGGLTYYADKVKAGALSLAQVGADFAGSAEFRSATQGKTNAQLVDTVYLNTLDRHPDAGGAAYYTDRLNHGMSVADFAADLAFSQEHYNLLSTHIIGGIDVL